MREIETKVLDIDKKALEKRLAELKAKREYCGPVENIYFDFQGGELKKSGSILRLRKQGKKVMLTFKTSLKSDCMKIMEEKEIGVSNFKEAKKILCSVGMQEIKRLKKKRTSYILGNVRIEIDEHKGIPAFAEIEAPSEKDIKETLKKLGLSRQKTVGWNFWQILAYYKKE
ncbi:MAG: class IV adenylate cyclase [Candidatus Anstonellales archaeon]